MYHDGHAALKLETNAEQLAQQAHTYNDKIGHNNKKLGEIAQIGSCYLSSQSCFALPAHTL